MADPTPADDVAASHDQAGGSVPERFPGHLRDRFFAGAMSLLVAISLPLLLRQGRDQWFVLDEWEFLSQRSLSDPGSLFRPHNEHWVTLPAIAYRVVWQFVGLRSYVPYQLMAVLTHAAVVVALVAIARRAGVSRVIAFAAAVLMLFFGPGAQNITWGFQIGLTGALAFGCIQILLADHDGRWSRRDVLGLVSGAAAVMCTGGLGALMAGAAAVVAFTRRGWRAGAAHLLVPAGLFATWTVLADPDNPGRASPRAALAQARNLVGDALSALAQDHLIVAVLLTGLTVGSLALVAFGERGSLRGSRVVVPAVLAATGVGVAVVIGVGRPTGTIIGADGGGRYTYLITALWLPALATAADELGRRWRPATAIAVCLVALALPSNYRDIALTGTERLLAGAPNRVYALGESDRLEAAPRRLQPDPLLGPQLTAGFLRSAKASGRWMPEQDLSGPDSEWADFALTVLLHPAEAYASASPTCRALDPADVPISVRSGDVLRIRADPSLATVSIIKVGDPSNSAAFTYWNVPPGHQRDLELLSSTLVSIQGLGTKTSASLCTA